MANQSKKLENLRAQGANRSKVTTAFEDKEQTARIENKGASQSKGIRVFQNMGQTARKRLGSLRTRTKTFERDETLRTQSKRLG